MISEWKEFRLGDITEWASGGTPSKQNADFWNGTIPWISASSMGSNRYNESDLKITQEGLKAGSRLAKKDSILLLVRGSTLHQRIPVGITTSDVSFNQDVKAIRAKEEFIDPWYLLFWFMAKEKDLLNMVENTGIGAGKLDTNRLQNLLIRIPPDSERKKILLFAKALDDKLWLNRQINQTLEALAQAIFKSWFVDFEPVKAKIAAIEAGEDTEVATRAAMSAISGKTDEELDQLQAEQPECYIQLKTTAELFPATMQESELGEIPKGWRIGGLGEFASISSGKRPKQKFDCKNQEFNIPLIGASSIMGYVNEILYRESVLVIGRVGTLGIIQRTFQPSYPSDNTLVIRSEHQEYVYQILNLIDYGSLNVGSTQPLITQTSIKHNKVIISDDSLLDIFEKISASMFSKINSNNTENQSLSDLRDSLLPKLLSGELEVNDVDKMES